VLTNEHVVASATKVHVELVTHERIPASVVFADPRLDLALLQLDDVVEGLTPVELREAAARPGEWVMAVGQPYGLGHTVTVGVVSGLGRDYTDLGRPKGLQSDGVWSFIQTDASINIGNSGGPLVDAEGRVVGITTAVRADGQGLAFAVPSAMARHFLHEVWTYGRVRHPRLGLRAEDAEAGSLAGRGAVVRITGVDDVGPAAAAELREGDFILAVDGHAVTRVSQVAYWAELAGVGADLDLTVVGAEGQAKIVTLQATQVR
jgi:S1-C subfamily serine protease